MGLSYKIRGTKSASKVDPDLIPEGAFKRAAAETPDAYNSNASAYNIGKSQTGRDAQRTATDAIASAIGRIRAHRTVKVEPKAGSGTQYVTEKEVRRLLGLEKDESIPADVAAAAKLIENHGKSSRSESDLYELDVVLKANRDSRYDTDPSTSGTGEDDPNAAVRAMSRAYERRGFKPINPS